jgi:dTDP-4-amino-4,6-dideoxygalactose transaminase
MVPFLDLATSHQALLPELDAAWHAVITDSAFVGGRFVDVFEREWAAYCGTATAIGVANGTDALVLSLRALGVGPGDEVIVPSNTFIATAAAVVACGARPRFVDVDPDTLLVTPGVVAEAMTPRCRAVIVVHLYGQMADMPRILDVAERAGVPVVEDAAQAHGATWAGRPAGSWGAAGCFSFYPSKNLGAIGDAGAIVTDDLDLARAVRSLANHGRAPDDADLHIRVGTNSRLDGLQAAVLSAKLPSLDSWNAARRSVVERYREACADLPVTPVAEAGDGVPVHYVAPVRVAARDDVRRALKARGVDTKVHYPVPCHLQPGFREFGTGDLPIVERAAGELLSLPLSPTMTDEEVDHVCAALRDAVHEPKVLSSAASSAGRAS